MKVSQVLFKQNIGRQIRGLWYIQGRKTPTVMASEKILKAKGFEIVDPKEVVAPKRTIYNFKKDFEFLKPPPILEDETHPDWKDRPCLEYGDNDLLIEGVPQAQLITKTVVFKNVLPHFVENLVENVSEETHQLVQRLIKNSVIFDATQDLLPKLKDPERVMWNFPRVYGIPDVRKTSNLTKKFIQLCDCLSGPEIANTRYLLDNALLCLPFEKEFERYEFLLTYDLMLMSENPLTPAGQVNIEDHNFMELPDLHPMHHSIGLNEKKLYKFDNLYPLTPGCNKKNVHTVFLYYDKTKVKNTTELEVTETQIFARDMIKAFTAAAASARQRFGSDVKELPEPVTVQCIQSDGKGFYFSVYQLNTLNLEGDEGIKNYCWQLPKLNLYETADYVNGKPVLEGYNPEVFNRTLAFYKNY